MFGWRHEFNVSVMDEDTQYAWSQFEPDMQMQMQTFTAPWLWGAMYSILEWNIVLIGPIPTDQIMPNDTAVVLIETPLVNRAVFLLSTVSVRLVRFANGCRILLAWVTSLFYYTLYQSYNLTNHTYIHRLSG